VPGPAQIDLSEPLMNPVPHTTVRHLLDSYSVLLLDAYGVLNCGDEVLPGARELLSHLHENGRQYWVLTNDGSRLPDTASRRLLGLGLAIPPERIITSAALIAPYFAQHGLAGAHCVVLGTEDSHRAVRDAGGLVVAADTCQRADVLVICDEGGYPFLPTLNAALNLVFRTIDDLGAPPVLLQANPDFLFPRAGGRFGFTAGSIAMLLEQAIALRYPDLDEVRCDRLGKPFPAIFEEAHRRSTTMSMLMIGDQLDTDILGAVSFGIDAALVASGLHRPGQLHANAVARPTFLLSSLWP